MGVCFPLLPQLSLLQITACSPCLCLTFFFLTDSVTLGSYLTFTLLIDSSWCDIWLIFLMAASLPDRPRAVSGALCWGANTEVGMPAALWRGQGGREGPWAAARVGGLPQWPVGRGLDCPGDWTLGGMAPLFPRASSWDLTGHSACSLLCSDHLSLQMGLFLPFIFLSSLL